MSTMYEVECDVTSGNASAYCLEATTADNVTQTSPSEVVIWTPDVIQRVATILVTMLLTLLGNTAIIIVLICSKYRKRYNRVNIFIINLAFGDLAVCFATMTTEILFVAFGEWVLGAFGCKFLTYIQVVTLSSTTFIMTSMGFDRYQAICKPLRFSSSVSRARKLILVSWILAFVFAIPQVFVFVQTVDGYHPDGTVKYKCVSQGYTAQWQRKVYFTFMTVYILVLPAILISYCYINVARVVWKQGKMENISSNSDTSLRRFIVNKGVISLAKMKTVKMTFSIIITFIVCWTPYFVTTLILIYSDYQQKIPNSVMAFAETVALLQSAVNPILYGIFNIKLIRGLTEVFCPDKLTRKRPNSLAIPQQNGFNGYSGTTDKRNMVNLIDTSKRMTIRCNDRLSTSSSGSLDKSTSHKAHGCIIAEANQNGFRLRVRFMAKEAVHVHDWHGRCLYPALKGGNDSGCSNRECSV